MGAGLRSSDVFLIVMAIIIGGVLLYGIFVVIRQYIKSNLAHRIAEAVGTTSKRLVALKELNRQYTFHDISPVVEHRFTFQKKYEYDRFVAGGWEQGFSEFVGKYWSYLTKLSGQADDNQKNYIAYRAAVTKLPPFVSEREAESLSVPFDRYHSLEQEMIRKTLLHPVTDLHVTIEAHYISPGGRKSYSDSRTYNMDQARQCMENRIKRIEREKEHAPEIERKKMTYSLRYDVMKRDHFRCRLCGKSAEDGVQLEVDHIVPVSKGGKTEISNLQTLCMACNRGKRDKYDEGEDVFVD